VHRAAASGYLGRLEALLAADGARALERFDDRGMTPLTCAVEGGDLDTVAFLLKAGADINAPDSHDGDTAIIWAVTRKDLPMVKLLLAAKADVDQPGDRHWSAYNHACEWRESKRHPELREIYLMVAAAHRR
jgi:ankyrin repeat protein